MPAIHWTGGTHRRGVDHGWLSFADPLLADWRWPVIRITGAAPGPHLCVTAGIHINEVSSIRAAQALPDAINPADLHGTISILPIVNQPADYTPAKAVVPIDGKNLHFSFPGAADGSFTERLAHALMRECFAEADMVIDLHGGDFGEEMARYVVCQRVGDADFDDRAVGLARAFGADLLVALAPEQTAKPGRCCTALAPHGLPALVSEAGDNGAMDAEAVAWHVAGVINVARHMGMLPVPPDRRPPRAEIGDYLWVTAPVQGLLETRFAAGDPVRRGQVLAVLRDPFGAVLAEVLAPADGYAMFRISLMFVPQGGLVTAIGVPMNAAHAASPDHETTTEEV